VISSEPIGPVACPPNATLIKTPWQGPDKQAAWEVELASDAEGKAVVWLSRQQAEGDRVTVNASTGQFVGPLAGKDALSAGSLYYGRVRQKSAGGEWSAWSNWHQGFAVMPATTSSPATAIRPGTATVLLPEAVPKMDNTTPTRSCPSLCCCRLLLTAVHP
jgi:hypothetical protein